MMRGTGYVSGDSERRAAGGRAALAVVLLALGATASCRQIAGIHPMPMPCADPLMIDDMEDGTPSICDSDGRTGAWYYVPDGTIGATQTLNANAPIPGGRDSSQRAVEFSGGGFADWGALTGFNLNDPGLSRQVYQAGSVGGLTFWMKSNVPVTVQVLTPSTVLVQDDGGQCVAGTAPADCNNPFAFQITAPASSWTQYNVPFSALRQLRAGTAMWDPTKLLAVQFQVGPGADFDVWIDDIAFYYCTGTVCTPTCLDPKFNQPCAAKDAHPAACYLTGTECADITTWCSDPLLIDDMEDGDNQICPTGGRKGTWWAISDGTSTDLTPAVGSIFTQELIPGGRGQSRAAAHLAGSGFAGAAGLDLGLAVKGQTYDASAFNGISFWMKTNAAYLNFDIFTPDTIPVSDGGSCMDSDTALNCNNPWWFGVNTPKSDTWFQVAVPFAAFAQLPANSTTTGNVVTGSATWDPTKLDDLWALVEGPAAFDLWIDDISFFPCTGSACVPLCTDDPDLPTPCPAAAGQLAGCWPAGVDCANRQPRPFQYLGVWGSGPNDVWILGLTFDGFAGMAFHWDGAAWTRSDTGGMPSIRAVSGQGADAVWAVADHGAVARWDGSTWVSTTAGTDNSLRAVWVGGPDDLWTAAYPGTLQHWNGSAWSTGTSITQPINGLWGSAPNDIWAIGGAILHFDGSSWSPVTTPASVSLNGVWGSGPNDVWAVGASILHFDGASWAASPGTPPGPFYAVWGSGPTDVWAVGQAGVITHWDGATWSAVPSPTKYDLYAVWGSGPTDVWAVGNMHAVTHFDGVSWSSVSVVGQAP
jgi:hypothetical protein